MRLINKVLLTIIAFIVLVTTVTTVWAITRDRWQGQPVTVAAKSGEQTALPATEQNFSGLGRLRTTLKDRRSVVISVVFPYNAADTAFTEELVRNIPFFRATITEHFEKMTAAAPLLHDETALKAAFLEKFNSRLLLGQIDKLFFSEFVILD